MLLARMLTPSCMLSILTYAGCIVNDAGYVYALPCRDDAPYIPFPFPLCRLQHIPPQANNPDAQRHLHLP